MSLGQAAAGLRARLDAKHQAREVGIRNARQAVRCSANAIRAAHRSELDRAGELLAEARELLEVAASVIAAHPGLVSLPAASSCSSLTSRSSSSSRPGSETLCSPAPWRCRRV